MKCERNAKKYLTHLHRSLIDQNQLKLEHVAKNMFAVGGRCGVVVSSQRSHRPPVPCSIPGAS
ncbi:hypothetical protein T12_11109 [Trichinella patagoniensis]|uniref:Uncharacterized protein n=1 Tax=Trichinella patagoniensis TaxID=990121 RepID=A0A0V0ZB73_9BILA|nr:hypothetical protein T12_11109 [Trichinella patagoniensis]